jgi:hypothetical protein
MCASVCGILCKWRRLILRERKRTNTNIGEKLEREEKDVQNWDDNGHDVRR